MPRTPRKKSLLSNLTPQHVDRALDIAQAVVGLASDVWQARKPKKAIAAPKK